MGILGSQTEGTTFAEQTVSGSRPIRLEVASYTPAQDENITEIYWFCWNKGAAAQTIPIGIYRADTDALVATATLNIPNNADYAWVSQTGYSIFLTSGIQYKIALGCPSTSAINFRTEGNVTGGMTNGGSYPALPDPWTVHNTPVDTQFGLYAVTESAVPEPSVTVTQTELTPGGTISGTYANYTTTPTTLEGIRGTNTISSAGASPQITGLTITPDADPASGSFTATISPLVSTGTQQFLRFSDSAQGVADPTWRLS